MRSRETGAIPANAITARRADLPIVETVASQAQLRDMLGRQRKLSMLKLGARLLDLALITEEQLSAALKIQSTHVGRHLGHILVDLGYVTAVQLHHVLCEQLGIPFVRLEEFGPDENVVRLLPEDLMRECSAVPLCHVDGKLVVAVADPLDAQHLERLRFFVQTALVPVMAAREDIEEAIRRHYSPEPQFPYARALLDRMLCKPRKVAFEREPMPGNEIDGAVLEFVKKMIFDAKASGASAIHVDSGASAPELVVRFRHHGELTPYQPVPEHLRRGVVDRIKTLAGLDPALRARAQEGRIDALENGPANLQLRVVAIPTADGNEHLAMKLLPGTELLPLTMLGLDDFQLETIKQFFTEPAGLVVVSGPRESGKTTTAYAMLSLLDQRGTKIWTAESPIEARRPGWSQVAIDAAKGSDYPSVMRGIVRADADAILVGEVRDRETLALGVEAALRGCRVVALVDGSGSAETVSRLCELGVNTFSLSDALLGIVSQRLARRLCPACRVSRPLSGSEIEVLLQDYCAGIHRNPSQVRADWAARFGNELRLYTAAGCEVCGGTGYAGRIGLFEVLPVTPSVRRLVRQRRPMAELLTAAAQAGMRTLRQDALEKALAGHCDLQEVRAATV